MSLTPLFDRNNTMQEAIHHVNRRRVVILRGNTGIGKTELLKHIAVKLAETSLFDPIMIFSTRPYKPFLLDIIYQLFKRACLPPLYQEEEWEENFKHFNRVHTKVLLSLIYDTFEKHPELILCIDNIDDATPQGLNLCRTILEHDSPPRLVTTATSINRLKYLVWQAEVIPIKPLTKASVYTMVTDYIKQHGLRVQSIKMFQRQIYSISAGNPLAVVNKLRYCRHEPTIKKHLLIGHERSSGRTEIDMSFIIIILTVLATMSRYIARSMSDMHLYMMSSIVAALSLGARFILFKGGNKEEL